MSLLTIWAVRELLYEHRGYFFFQVYLSFRRRRIFRKRKKSWEKKRKRCKIARGKNVYAPKMRHFLVVRIMFLEIRQHLEKIRKNLGGERKTSPTFGKI